jgi:hypothetical protein
MGDQPEEEQPTTANGLPIRRRGGRRVGGRVLSPEGIEETARARLIYLLTERPEGFESELNRIATTFSRPGLEAVLHIQVLHALGLSEPTGGAVAKVGILRGIALGSALQLAEVTGDVKLLQAIAIDITLLTATGMKNGAELVEAWLMEFGKQLGRSKLSGELAVGIMDACHAALQEATPSAT